MSEKKILTRAQVADYIASGGNKCPFCGSSNIEGDGSVKTDSNYAWQHVSCHDCDAMWDDIYTLTGVDPGKYGDWKPEPGLSGSTPIHPEIADEVTVNDLVELLKRCSAAFDFLPNTRLPGGKRTYDLASQLDKILPRERRIEPSDVNR